ncbi:DUF3987 domain-containing protein [Nitratidesulfovibrio sp. D1]|uniref:DUF3987 domain-containing protein n=1 Tax=Nitratidesulfovibrio sp. D1 TaxID=3440151 RepID=UPI003EC05581
MSFPRRFEPHSGASFRRHGDSIHSTALVHNGQAYEEELFAHALDEHINAIARKLKDGPEPNSFFRRTSFPHPSIPPSLALVRPIADACGQDYITVLCALLGSTSMALRGRYRVRVTSTWEEPLVDYWLMIGESGTRKSLLVAVLRKPFDGFATAPPKEYLLRPGEAETRKTQRKLADRQASRVARARLKGISLDFSEVAAREISALSAETVTFLDKFKQDPPVAVRLFFENGSLRNLARLMSEQGGCASLLDAEGGIFSSRTFKDMDINLLLKAHAMEHYSHDPHNGTPCQITSPAMSMLIFAQQSVLHGLLTNKEAVDRGLMARFLPIQLHAPIFKIEDTYSDSSFTDATSKYEKKIRSMLERNYTQDSARGIQEIKTTKDAEKMFLAFKDENERLALRASTTPAIHSILRRLPGHAARIAGDIHAWKYDDPCAALISAEDAEYAIEISRYVLENATNLYDIEYQRDLFFAQKILSWIKRWDTQDNILHFDSRIAQQNVRGLNKDNAIGALHLLCENHFLEDITTPKTSPIFVVNPQIFTRRF